MSSKKILVCIFCSLLAGSSFSEEIARKTIKIVFPSSSNEDEIKNKFNLLGISTDEHSIITTHQENNYINLTCFDCIVRIVDQVENVRGSFNERTLK